MGVGEMFQFKIGLDYVPDVELLIEIPEELHQRICLAVGTDKMARYEFCFHFMQFLKERFPEVDQLINQKIDEWKREHYGLAFPKHLQNLYGLISPWFEEL